MPHVVPTLFVNVLWLVFVHKCVGLILLLFQPKKIEKSLDLFFLMQIYLIFLTFWKFSPNLWYHKIEKEKLGLHIFIVGNWNETKAPTLSFPTCGPSKRPKIWKKLTLGDVGTLFTLKHKILIMENFSNSKKLGH